MSTWDELSLAEKAEMIGVAVKRGYTNLSDIKDKYNEFAEGGNTDDDLVDWIIREEGFIGSPQDIGDGKMTIGSGLTAQKWHDQYKRNGNKWTIDDNRRAVKEEVANRRKWAEKNIPNWDSLPSSSQKALLSYKYNYDFNRANSPKLFKALADSNLQEAARQMDATSSNAVFRKGLQSRRQREQEWFLRDVASPQVPDAFYQPAVSTQVYNPYVQGVESARMLPMREPDPNSYIRTREVSPEEQRRRRFQENLETYQRFNALMDMIDIKKNQTPSYVPNHPLFELVNGLAEGGSIHIKPSHRGRLTELKKRTGKSEAELYRTGSPATRKMITFARNARKWKHGDGGYINLFGEGGEGNPMNYEHRGTIYDDDLKRQGITHIAELPEVTITGRDLRKPYFSAFDGSAEPYIELFGALSKGLQPLSISQHVGAAFDAAQGERNYFESLFNGNSGFFTDKYATEHPWVSTLGNTAGDIATPFLLSKAPATYRSGIRFMQNVDDRYQGMKDAAEYAANKSIKGNNAADITNYIWIQREGVKASDGLIRPATKYRTGIKLAKKEAEDNYGLLSEAGGNQTINVHLGGAHYGDKPWELVAMEYPKKKWASKFFSTSPKGTVFGELGKTKNFAEQYTEVHPNRWKAFKDALINKTEVNPYWDDFEQSITERIKTASDPAVKAYYQNLLNGNNPLSIDSYKMMMDLTKKGKYALRYDSKPMGMFNSQGVKQRHVYEELQQMSPKEQVDAINNWLMALNPKARPAYLQNGELMIPRPLLYKNTPSNNTWLKSK